jgi:replication-associated recombination protein RarA
MKSPLFHPTTQLLLDNLQMQLPQSLLLSGPRGIGLLTTVRYLTEGHISAILYPKNAKGQQDDTGTISIEAIRDLYEHTRTKSRTKRIVVIDNAEQMSRGAQAAFLKLLEEPNSTTFFILTSHAPAILLPTVRSRTQHLHIQPITANQSTALIKEQGIYDTPKLAQLLFLASGLPAQLTRLTKNDEYFSQHAAIINDARNFITADLYQKMRLIQKYRSSREEALRLIDSTMTILHFSLQTKQQPKIIEQLARLLVAREGIAANQSIPLQLAQAVL